MKREQFENIVKFLSEESEYASITPDDKCLILMFPIEDLQSRLIWPWAGEETENSEEDFIQAIKKTLFRIP